MPQQHPVAQGRLIPRLLLRASDGEDLHEINLELVMGLGMGVSHVFLYDRIGPPLLKDLNIAVELVVLRVYVAD